MKRYSLFSSRKDGKKALPKVQILKYGPKRGSNRPNGVRTRGTLAHTARPCGRYIDTTISVYHQPVSRGQPSGLQTPSVPLKITNKIDFRPIWGPFNPGPLPGNGGQLERPYRASLEI